MTLSEHQFGPMYHGTRADIKNGFIFPGQSGVAYATSDPEQARLYGETKFHDNENPVTVYRVSPVQPNEVQSRKGETEGETHYLTSQGFLIHK